MWPLVRINYLRQYIIGFVVSTIFPLMIRFRCHFVFPDAILPSYRYFQQCCGSVSYWCRSGSAFRRIYSLNSDFHVFLCAGCCAQVLRSIHDLDFRGGGRGTRPLLPAIDRSAAISDYNHSQPQCLPGSGPDPEEPKWWPKRIKIRYVVFGQEI